jgi:hypothetical protein
MTAFLPDTNVWIDVGRDDLLTLMFEEAQAAGHRFLIAPPALIEIVRGTVRHGKETFPEDKKTYLWMKKHKCEVLELTRPFMAKVLKTTLSANSGVVPKHYEQQIDMVANSASLDEFVERCKAGDSVWKNIESLDRIHEEQIEKELRALEELARQGKNLDIPGRLSKMFGAPGCRPNPLIISRRFSAAIEYLETSIRKVVQGGKPRKNDRGLYVDWQLLMYLAIPDAMFLTNEDFSGEIKKSPQKDRIAEPYKVL